MPNSQSKKPIVLYLDASVESVTIRKALQDAAVEFDVVFGSANFSPLPAIETEYGVLCGYNDIRRYLCPPSSEALPPKRQLATKSSVE